MVQIHTPRPLHRRTNNLQVHNGCGAPAARPGGQWSRRIRLDHSFPSQINGLRCVLNYNFKSIFTDNTDNISGFAWEFEVQPNVFRSSERREIDMKSGDSLSGLPSI